MEKTAEYLKGKGWTVRVVFDGSNHLVTLWRHPSKDWEVDFVIACELQHGIELREAKDGKE